MNRVIEQLFSKWGFISKNRYTELMVSGTSVFSSLSNQPENYPAFMQAYENEVYAYACIYLISNTIAGLPLKIYQDVKKDGEIQRQEITNHLFYTFSKIEPNPYSTFYDFKESISANLELTGNAYILLDGIKNGKPTQIYSLNSSKMIVVASTDPKVLIQGYKYKIGLKEVPYKPEEIIHLKYFNPNNEYYGQSSLAAGQCSIDTIQQARKQNNKIFRNGCSIGGVLETDQRVQDEAYVRLKNDFNSRHQGSSNAHKVAVLDQGLKYKEIGLTLKDLEFIAGMKLTREEICTLFQVPPILVGILENSSYNNIKEAQKIFWEFCVVPKLRKQEAQYNKIIKLFGEGYCKFDTSEVEILKENLTEKIDNAKKLWDMGVPLNSLIKPLNLPLEPIPGGDIGYLPFSVSAVGTESEEPAEPTTPPTEEESKGFIRKTIEWTHEKMLNKSREFTQLTRRIEGEYKKALDKLFKAQEQEVLSNLEKYKSMKMEPVGENMTAIIATFIDGVRKAININSVLFDYDDEVNKLKKTSIKYHTEALDKNAQQEITNLELGISFNVSNPRTIKWLQAYGLKNAKFVMTNKLEDLRKTLIEGVQAGEGAIELSKRVKEYYTQVENYQTMRVARTETVAAANQGSLEVYKEAGLKKKAWNAVNDEDTRDSHSQAMADYKDGIPIDDDFHVGDDAGPCPGQLGSPENDCNCRCNCIGLE